MNVPTGAVEAMIEALNRELESQVRLCGAHYPIDSGLPGVEGVGVCMHTHPCPKHYLPEPEPNGYARRALVLEEPRSPAPEDPVPLLSSPPEWLRERCMGMAIPGVIREMEETAQARRLTFDEERFLAELHARAEWLKRNS